MNKASNNLIKELKKQKREGDLLFLDNIKIIKDAIAGGLKPKYILIEGGKFDDENLKNGEFGGELVFLKNQNVLLVDGKTIEQLSDSKTPQGVVCVTYYLQHIVEKPKNNFLVLDGLQDPGNVGSLIRTAYACGFNEVFLVDSVRPTNSKLVRSSVGAIFLAKVMSLSADEFVSLAKKWELNLLKADMDGQNIFDFQPSGQVGVVIGNEGQGVSEKLGSLCSQSVKIPMQKGIESLNAAVSGSIIMYQINKKRLS